MFKVFSVKARSDTGIGYRWVMLICFVIFFVSAFCSIFVMMGLLAAGLREGWRAIQIFWGWMDLPQHFSSRPAAALECATRGLEFLLLAPLGLLVLYSLAKYLNDFAGLGAFENNKPDRVLQESDNHEKSNNHESVYDRPWRDLLRVKALGVSLLIAVVATDMVSGVLIEPGLQFRQAVCDSLTIVVLGFYFWSLEKLSSSHNEAAVRSDR